MSRLEFSVHSANPVTSEQIKGLLHNYQKHIRSEELSKAVEHHCEDITKLNFSKKYDGLRAIVITYNDIGLSGSEQKQIILSKFQKNPRAIKLYALAFC